MSVNALLCFITMIWMGNKGYGLIYNFICISDFHRISESFHKGLFGVKKKNETKKCSYYTAEILKNSIVD